MEKKSRNHDFTRNEVIVHSLQRFFDVLNLVVKWGLGSWAAVSIFREAAGQETVIRVFSNAFENQGPPITIYLLISALFIWAMLERYLRRTKTVYFQNRIKKLESKMDPNRTGSELTPRGDTNPKDL